MQATGADGGEPRALGRLGLPLGVVAPADGGAVGAEGAGVNQTGADGGEPLGRRRVGGLAAARRERERREAQQAPRRSRAGSPRDAPEHRCPPRRAAW